MCISQSPASLIRINVTKTKGDAFMPVCCGRESGSLWTLLHTAVKFHINLTLKIMEPECIINFTEISCCAKCAAVTAAMSLIRSSHRAISSVLMYCCWCVRWSQSQPGGRKKKKKKHWPRCTTPHCSFFPSASCAQPMSQTTSDDGALSFQVERALKVRVGRRPTSLILAGLCHLVLEDK